ncbi:uncharacterized protein [Antedon mediterranea]|uniref:uncharacterized protein n=1 Tax=Antedon mediterranea TaxID=105859 RepID=UPI003AF568D8
MLEKNLMSICLISIAISSGLSASVYPTCKCPAVKPDKCPKLNCPGGSLKVEHPCIGCCPICGKTEGEECGGVNDIYGRCSPDLDCQPDMFTLGKLTNRRGTCSKPAVGFDMTADFLRSDDLQTELWDDWEFSFGSSEPKELYNVFDVGQDFLKQEDLTKELWEGWGFSFSSIQESDDSSSSEQGTVSSSNQQQQYKPLSEYHEKDKSSSSEEDQYKMPVSYNNDVLKNDQTTNGIWDDWLFSFSSGSEFSNMKSSDSEDVIVEGSGYFYNKIMKEYPPV